MASFSLPQQATRASAPALEHMLRKPQRVTATLPWHLVQRLQARADEEGRSLSNLLAFLLEGASAVPSHLAA